MLANFPPTFRLDFVGATALDSRITFTRASGGTYFDSSGILQTAGVDTPRFQYSSTLGNTALLIERGRTNTCLWCRDLTNAAWAPTNMTAALDQTGIDNAANSASSITATANNATILQARVLASAIRVMSASVKRITGTGGVDMTLDGGATWTAITVTGSWARQSIPAQTLANPSVGFRLQTNGDKIAVDYCQNEFAGTLAVATSPIATTTASVSRSSDVAVISSLGSWFNAAEGTLFIKAADLLDTGGTATHSLAAFSNGTGNERLRIAYTTIMAWLTTVGGVTQANLTLGSSGAGIQKLVGTYKANRFHGAGNGTLATPDASGTIPTLSEFHIGAEGAAVNIADALICEIAYWNRSRSDGALAAMTKL